jgi:Flp pilus assembly pilin Flp
VGYVEDFHVKVTHNYATLARVVSMLLLSAGSGLEAQVTPQYCSEGSASSCATS